MVLFFGGDWFRLEKQGRASRAEVVRRPRKKPGKMIHAKNMVKGIAPVVPMTPTMAPMALAA